MVCTNSCFFSLYLNIYCKERLYLFFIERTLICTALRKKCTFIEKSQHLHFWPILNHWIRLILSKRQKWISTKRMLFSCGIHFSWHQLSEVWGRKQKLAPTVIRSPVVCSFLKSVKMMCRFSQLSLGEDTVRLLDRLLLSRKGYIGRKKKGRSQSAAHRQIPGPGDLTNHLLTVSWHCTTMLPTNSHVQVNIYRDGRAKTWWCDISTDAKRRQATRIHCVVLERCFSRTWRSELLLDDVQQTLTGREARLGPGQETMEQ